MTWVWRDLGGLHENFGEAYLFDLRVSICVWVVGVNQSNVEDFHSYEPREVIPLKESKAMFEVNGMLLPTVSLIERHDGLAGWFSNLAIPLSFQVCCFEV